MVAGTWHGEMLHTFTSVVAAEPDIEECWVYGSGARGDLDEWSDLDLAVVVRPGDVLRFASPSWLSVLGPVWTYQTFSRDRGSAVRVVFRDGHLVDLIAVTDRAAVPTDRRPLDLSDPTGELVWVSRRAPSGVPDISPLALEFRFTAALSLMKFARGDLLIGGHLALELPRLCLVAAMLLRDREVGSAHHRYGGPRNAVLDQVFDLIPDADARRDGVVDLVDATAGLFDELAAQLWPDYVPDWSGLTALLDRVRAR